MSIKYMQQVKAMYDTNIAIDQRTVDEESASLSDCLPSDDRTDRLIKWHVTVPGIEPRTRSKENFGGDASSGHYGTHKGAVAQRAPYENKICFF